MKYFAFVRLAARGAIHARGELLGRAVFFAVILFVFTSLWTAVQESGMPIAAAPASLVWYLAITEWILLSAPAIHIDIQESIRRGDVVCQLGRPVSFVGAALAEGIGLLLVRAPILFLVACGCAYALTGQVPPPSVLAAVVPLGLIGSAVITALFLGLGLCAFWLGDASPLWWVTQKLIFVLGGLMMPVALYPTVIQRVAAFTPFPAILAGPATLALNGSTAGAGTLALVLAAWSIATVAAVEWLFRRATGSLTVNGG